MPEETGGCIVCGRTNPTGITVCGHFICRDCEQVILGAQVDDPSYEQIVRKLRQLWQAAGVDAH